MPEEGPPGPKGCNSLMMFCALKDCSDYLLVNTLLYHNAHIQFVSVIIVTFFTLSLNMYDINHLVAHDVYSG